jgi:hypothetical protein
MALAAILVLIPLSADLDWGNEFAVRWRRSYAEVYMAAALDSIESNIGLLAAVSMGNPSNIGSAQGLRKPVHYMVPVAIEPVLALLAASMYEYCQRGNLSKMRTRANHAVTLAMDLSLHNMDSQVTEFTEAKRRAWWTTVSSHSYF